MGTVAAGAPTHVFAAGVVMDSFDPVSKHMQAKVIILGETVQQMILGQMRSRLGSF